MLIGNLTRDPELRYTPSGVAVCSFGIATNRSWTTQDGEKKEDAQFHRVVAWGQLAEICSQLLTKGSRTYVEGRIQYREWTGTDEVKKQTTEIVIEDMIVLDSRQAGGEDFSSDTSGRAAPTDDSAGLTEDVVDSASVDGQDQNQVTEDQAEEKKAEETKPTPEEGKGEEDTNDDIPF